ncbi:MAG TPA: hypothetical protein VGJ73_12980 [Verrucomicrobiae bacterium]|jgi:hypothetical protein
MGILLDLYPVFGAGCTSGARFEEFWPGWRRRVTQIVRVQNSVSINKLERLDVLVYHEMRGCFLPLL